MNAPHRLFVIGTPFLRLGALAACTALGGCLSEGPLKLAPIDPRSPIAAEANRLAHENKDYPSFAEIPPEPTDVRPTAAWGQSARQVELAGDQLLAQTAPSTWTLDRSEAFAAEAARLAGAPAAVGSTTPATEAYVRELRKRATPPPPPKR